MAELLLGVLLKVYWLYALLYLLLASIIFLNFIFDKNFFEENWKDTDDKGFKSKINDMPKFFALAFIFWYHTGDFWPFCFYVVITIELFFMRHLFLQHRKKVAEREERLSAFR